MYLLRTITKSKSGKILIEDWKTFKDIKSVVNEVIKIEPDEYQCFEANEISNQVFMAVEGVSELRKKEERRKQYEKLKMEFDPD